MVIFVFWISIRIDNFSSTCVVFLGLGIDPIRLIRISALLNGAMLLLDIAAIVAKKTNRRYLSSLDN